MLKEKKEKDYGGFAEGINKIKAAVVGKDFPIYGSKIMPACSRFHVKDEPKNIRYVVTIKFDIDGKALAINRFEAEAIDKDSDIKPDFDAEAPDFDLIIEGLMHQLITGDIPLNYDPVVDDELNFNAEWSRQKWIEKQEKGINYYLI